MYKLIILILFLIFNFHVYSQNDHMNMDYSQQDTMKMNSSEKPKLNTNMQMNMSMNGAVLLSDEMEQEGSGTSWMPASSDMHMKMYHSGSWMFMLHGAITLRYTKQQSSARGSDAISAPNWFMGSAQTRLSMNTQIMFRTMLSLDRLTDGGDGYPLLFQTGETWNGIALIDRQHPHDLVAELSTSFSVQLNKSWSTYLYFGYPGEPALGPNVFMHRSSAMSNPDATLSHHWQDATHITFGVVTIGLAFKNIKLEGSAFNGTEPNENRYDFDKIKFTSYSGRISYNPTEDISLQVSAGSVKDPESDGTDVIRRTASLLYSKEINSVSRIDISLIWGQNKDGIGGAQNSFIEEAEYYISGNSIYTRIENVEKTRHELGIEDRETDKEFIGAYTLGYKRKILHFGGLDLNAGLQGTIYSVPADIQYVYGKNPVSYQVYISIMPGH